MNAGSIPGCCPYMYLLANVPGKLQQVAQAHTGETWMEFQVPDFSLAATANCFGLFHVTNEPISLCVSFPPLYNSAIQTQKIFKHDKQGKQHYGTVG